MTRRTRMLTPLVLAAALATAACGDSGSSGASGGETSGSAASGDACAPVSGQGLVVLEDDMHLQNADNVIPAVTSATATANPAIIPALNAVSAALDTDQLIELNGKVDLQRQNPEDVAAQWVQQSGVTQGLQQGSGSITVGEAGFTESTVLANIYADVLDAAGFDASVRTVGNRDLYLPALISGNDLQVFPEYMATVTEALNAQVNGANPTPVASPDVQATRDALQTLADQVGLTFGDPSEAADQNAFAINQKLADQLDVSTLSELADACGDGSLVLGGPTECPTRPFCQVGLEGTYGLKFAEFVPLDTAGGPLTKAAIEQGQVSIGLVLSSDAVLAQG